MLHLLRSEVFRLRKRSQSWLLILIGVILVGLFYAAFLIAALALSGQDQIEVKQALRLPDVQQNGMSIAVLFGSILVAIMGAGLIGSEYSWNTIRPLLARATSRASLLTAKWITLALYTIVLTVLVVTVAPVVFSSAAAIIAGESPGGNSEIFRGILYSTGRIFIVMLPTAALAFMLALVTRSIAAGLAISIGLGFLEPAIFGILGMLSDAFDTIQKFGLAWGTERLLDIGWPNSSTTTAEAWQGAVACLGYTVVFIVVSYVVFRRRDVTSG